MTIFRTLLLLVSVALPIFGIAHAQEVTYSARLTDAREQPIDFATIVLMDADSVALSVGASDSLGYFSVAASGARWLRISHLAYRDTMLSLEHPLPEVIRLEHRSQALDEVVVKGEKPMMKITAGGIPTYDIDQLFHNSVVSNAYEMLLRLPGIAEENGAPKLVGTSSLTIVVNGKNMNIPQDQVLAYLKQIPIGAVQSAEVSYVPQPKYQAKGGSVNIVLKPQTTGEKGKSIWAVEAESYYKLQHYPDGGANTFLSYGGNHLSGRVSYNYGISRNNTDMVVETDPAPTSKLTPILSHTVGYTEDHSHRVFANLSYKAVKHEVSVDYFNKLTPRGHAWKENDGMEEATKVLTDYRNHLHHFAVDYAYDGRLRVGLFYTFFRKHNETETATTLASNASPLGRFENSTQQHNDVWGGFFSNEHTLRNGWQVNYGLHAKHSETQDHIRYTRSEGIYQLQDVQGSYKELALDAYAGVNKQLSRTLNLSLTIVGYYMDFETDRKSYLAPQVNLTYNPSPASMLQFSFNTSENYPSYWERQPFEEVQNPRQVWQGNPKLRPYTNYNTALLYILKGKYIFQIADDYNPHYFVQLMSHDQESNRLIFKTENWDYTHSISLLTIVPFSFWKRLNSRLLVSTSIQSSKASLENGISFDRNKLFLLAQLENDLKITDRAALNLSCTYVTGAHQGYYDLGNMITLNAGAKWSSKNGHWTLSVRGNDLLNRGMPVIKADYAGQHFRFEPTRDQRSVLMSVKYSFGTYSKKGVAQLETSRF